MKNLFIYILICISTIISAQEMIIDWDVCFGGEGYGTYARCIEALPNNRIVTVIPVSNNHSAFTNYHGGGDSWVLILDNNGDILLDRCFGGSNGDVFYDIEVFENNIYFIGFTTSTDGDVQSQPVGGAYDLWVVKTDFDLNIIWERRYGSLGTQDLRTAKLTEDGGLVLLMDFFISGGGDVSEYYGNTDIWVCEIDTDGEILWEKTLGNAYGTFAGSVMQTEDGKTIVLGEMDISGGMVTCEGHNNDGSRDIWIIALDETGEILWQNCLGGSHWEIGSDIIQDGDGYTFIGTTLSNDGDVEGYHWSEWSGDVWLVHIDNVGNLVWQRCLGGYNIESGGNVYKTADGGYLLVAQAESNNGDVNHVNCTGTSSSCQSNGWIIELDSDRNIIWNETHGSANFSSSIADVKRIGEKDFIIAGIIDEYDNHSGDINCSPYPINSGKSAWIYRLYDPDVGVNDITKNELLVYPNPAQNQIFFELPEHHQEIEIQIFDIYGKEIAKLKVWPQQTQVLWKLEHINAGVYFYQTELSGEVYRGKLIIN